MTAKEQIRALTQCGYESAIREIKRNEGKPLSRKRLHYHLDKAIDNGFVSRAVTLTKLASTSLTSIQLQRLIRRCLQLDWVIDAIYASKQGPAPEGTRRELIDAMIAHEVVSDSQEAIEILEDRE